MEKVFPMHKVTLICLLSLLVLPIQALAGDNQCVLTGIAEETGAAPEDIELTEARHQPIYVALGVDAAPGERLTFEVLVDGASYLTEEVELIEAQSADHKLEPGDLPVIELLASQNSRLGHLYRLAQGHQVEVAIHRDGTLAAMESFGDLAAKSNALLATPIVPQDVRSTLTMAARPQMRNICRDYCDDEQDACYYGCGQFGSASCYNACDDQWADCMENCGVCQPGTTTTTTYTVVSLTSLGISECHTSTPFGKGIYRAHHKRYKATTTTTVTSSNCSQTVTTQVSYFNILCWIWHYSSPYCYSLGPISSFC